MSYNPFRPQQRTAVITLDNGTKVRAEISFPRTQNPRGTQNLKSAWCATSTARSPTQFTKQ